jgi:UDP-N-acetylmuramoyl-tripeptide--D-alanyl-D-alanine ligase
MSLLTLTTLGQILNMAGDWPATPIHGVNFDSRAIKPGHVFLAMKGATTDGADYLAKAVELGAVAAITHRAVVGVDIPQLVVPNVLKALETWAHHTRAAYQGPVVAVGGGVGKTTTTALLKALLNAHAPIGSLNNHVGVPLTLARLPAGAPACVSEIGTNKVGEIAPLAKQVRPQVALITNVVEEHLEGLHDLETVRREELTVVEGLNPAGTLVVPEGLSLEGAGWQGKVLRFNPAAPLKVEILEPTPARVACTNAALAVVQALGITPDAAALARLAAVQPPKGRGQVALVGGVAVIDDSYNANPASVAAALVALQQRPVQRRVVVLGDMRELGAEEQRYHAELAPQLAFADGVVLVGPLMQTLVPLLPPEKLWGTYPNPDDFVPEDLAPRLHAGDAVLVKGSKSVTYVRHFAERLIAALAPQTQS